MTQLNFHHLRYFWRVARGGSLTRAARELAVSQSALSAQIRTLEDQLGVLLFDRVGRRLELTEAGRVALDYADEIFGAGDELVETLGRGRQPGQLLRIGAVATLSRNFQESFVQPLFGMSDVRFRLVSGRLSQLVERLRAHELDVVLSNRRVEPEEQLPARCRLLARQRVSLVGRPSDAIHDLREAIEALPLLLPGPSSAVRSAFDTYCQAAGLHPKIRAEVDDMAMLRLLARDGGAAAVVPAVVVRDEISGGHLAEYAVVPDVFESFYATTLDRLYPHPLLARLLDRDAQEILAMQEG